MSAPQLMHTWFSNTPNEDKEWKLTLKQNDTDLSWLYVLIRKMRIGTARIKTGGVLSVRTEEQYRLRGYSTQVMNGALHKMIKDKYAISMLLGIKDFYHRFFYAPIMANSSFFIRTNNLLRTTSIAPISKMKKPDATEIAKLYNHLNNTRTGTHVRPQYWSGFQGNFRILPGVPKPKHTILTHNKQGGISGYAALAYNEEKYVVSEIGGKSTTDFQTLTAAIGRSAQRRGIKQVEFRLPYDHPFANHCAPLGCNWEIEYPRNHGIMARIINLQILFQNLEMELTKRIQKSTCTKPANITLKTDIGTIYLNIHPSSVQIQEKPSHDTISVTISQMRLIQLIMGYRNVADFASDPDISIPRSALSILSALFPKTVGYIWWSDRF